jgi:hypothetical protein
LFSDRAARIVIVSTSLGTTLRCTHLKCITAS